MSARAEKASLAATRQISAAYLGIGTVHHRSGSFVIKSPDFIDLGATTRHHRARRFVRNRRRDMKRQVLPCVVATSILVLAGCAGTGGSKSPSAAKGPQEAKALTVKAIADRYSKLIYG